MKYIILDGKDILKMGKYTKSQLDNYSKQGYVIEEMPENFPKNKRKWEVKKENDKYIEKTKEEIEHYLSLKEL